MRGRAAAGWSGTSTGTTWRAWSHCPAGSPARSCRTGTPAPTSTSPPPGWSRSASPPWRPGPPGCRSSVAAGSGIGEFVQDGVNGYLTSDDEAMARAVARLVLDDDLRARMTAHNRQHAPRQSWDQIVAGAEAEYARALSLAGVR